MRKFGTDSEKPSTSLDLSSLEVNTRFNPEAQNSTQEEGVEQEEVIEQQLITETEVTGTQQQEEAANEDNAGTEESSQGAGQEEANTNTNTPSTLITSEVSDELIFKNLSEKLGRTITSFEDLTTREEAVELDPQVKAINDWKQKTGRPIEDFFKYQKDFSQVSDIDVAREALRLEYPTFSEEDLNIELENFIVTDEDLGSEAKRKSHELKKYATKGRKVLESLKAELGQPSTSSYTPEVKSKLEFAEQIQGQIEVNKKEQAKYNEGITKASLSTAGMRLNLAEDLSIDFKISEQDKKGIPNLIAEMPHWKTETGEWNHNAVVQDAIKIKHFDAMIKLAYEQGLNSGKEDLLKKAKNSTLGLQTTQEQGTQTKKPTIEGIDKLLGGQKLTMKFGRK